MVHASPIDRIVEDSAFRWERVLSAVRMVFCGAILLRLVAIPQEAAGNARLAMDVPLLVALIVFSAYVIRRLRARRATEALLVVSAAVDAIGCSLALLTNVLFPWPTYDGILRIPDVAALLVVAFASGFRLSPYAAKVAAVLHVLSAVVLIGVDVTRNADRITYQKGSVILFAILVGGTLTLALVLGTRVRGLVQDGAAQYLEAERAKMNLREVLASNHEMRSALSAVALETDLFLRAVQRRGERGVEPNEIVRVGADLRTELARLNGLVVGVRERTYAELAAMQGAEAVEVRATAELAIERSRARFPGVAIRRVGEDAARVVVAGGVTCLDRILSNLITNACEGDGRAQPANVVVDVRHVERDRVVIAVRDDGPGFPAQVLASSLHARGPSTKAEGSGLGLFLVHTIVSATGGSVERRSPPEGGAEVAVELPGAPASTAS